MGIKSRITGAPLSLGSWRELAASILVASSVAAQINLPQATWQELVAAISAASDLSASLKTAAIQELAAAISVTSQFDSRFGTTNDLRLLSSASKLKAYYDIRPQVSGAQASITLASTLRLTGTSPAVTWTNGSGRPRQAHITYKVGGALGTMQYSIWTGESDRPPYTGTSSAGAPTVSIGDGDTITFGAGTYNTADFHDIECTSINELTGLANAQLTSTLAGKGPFYRNNGLNGLSPSLLFQNAALSNQSGVPALLTGTDVSPEIFLLGETQQHITSTGASVLWGFSSQSSANNSKNYLRLLQCGPTIGSGLNSAYAIQRRDGAASPVTQTLVCDLIQADLDPHVIHSILGASAQINFNGMAGKVVVGSTNRGLAMTFDRFTWGGGNLGTAGFSSANWWLGHGTTLAIYDPAQPLTTQERLDILKALL
jgi:hypothetical protein